MINPIFHLNSWNLVLSNVPIEKVLIENVNLNSCKVISGSGNVKKVNFALRGPIDLLHVKPATIPIPWVPMSVQNALRASTVWLDQLKSIHSPPIWPVTFTAIALGVTIVQKAPNRLINILVGKENIIPIPELVLKMIASTVPRANSVPKKASANQVATAQLGTIAKQGRSSEFNTNFLTRFF